MKLFLVFCFIGSLAFSQKSNSILFINGYLHVGNGESIPNAAVGVKLDKIVLVKNNLAYTYQKEDWDTIINLNGQHIYPGFIAPNSTLGLTEIDAVRASNDFNEVGIYNPHVRSQIAYNVESNVLSTVKTNGILICQPTPRGGIVSGTSSIMATDGWNWEDATLLKDDGVHVNWPFAGYTGEHTKATLENYSKKVFELKQFFQNAKLNIKANAAEKDIRYASLEACFNGSKRVYFHANLKQELLDIIAFSKELGIAFPVIIGGDEALEIANRLKDAKIPILLNRIHNLPRSVDEPVNQPYALPFKLHEAGLLIGLQNEGDMEAMQVRNLPFLAGTAQAYGLTEEQAISTITLNTAKILGIDQYFGSIEEGKNATLFISEGNALDMSTNKVIIALINGKFINLINRQTELYLKYQQKYSNK